MSEDSPERRITLKNYVIAILLRSFSKLIAATYRVQFTEGEELFRKISREKEPVIFCAWHNQMFFTFPFLEKEIIRKGQSFVQMTSKSKDGDLGYLLIKMAGSEVVRGSSNRGGSTGLRRKYRIMLKNKSSTILYTDASHGPVYEAKAGAIILGQITRFPLHPISYTADRCWRIKSWDRLIIPKPFSRIRVRLQEAMWIPRKLSREELEAQRLQLQDSLNRMRETS